jgi:thiosulfate/3-mercaptopyruvate sulfurtransferase
MSRVRLLDGGTLDWSAFEELTKEETRPQPGTVTLRPADAGRMVEWEWIYDRVLSRRDPAVTLIDARSSARYRQGHIHGAIHIDSLRGVDAAAQRWRPVAELRTLYASVPRQGTVVIYCDDGFRMALAYLQLKRLGYRDVRLYNGGWAHWESTQLPMVRGATPYDGEFRL